MEKVHGISGNFKSQKEVNIWARKWKTQERLARGNPTGLR